MKVFELEYNTVNDIFLRVYKKWIRLFKFIYYFLRRSEWCQDQRKIVEEIFYKLRQLKNLIIYKRLLQIKRDYFIYIESYLQENKEFFKKKD